MDTLWLVRCPLYLNCVGAIVAAKCDVIELRVLPEVPETGRNVGLEVIPAAKKTVAIIEGQRQQAQVGKLWTTIPEVLPH